MWYRRELRPPHRKGKGGEMASSWAVASCDAFATEMLGEACIMAQMEIRMARRAGMGMRRNIRWTSWFKVIEW